MKEALQHAWTTPGMFLTPLDHVVRTLTIVAALVLIAALWVVCTVLAELVARAKRRRKATRSEKP